MLIIPIEKGLDWSRAPIVTGLFILLNCLTYFAWQTGDEERLNNAIQFYGQSVLPKIEYPIYLNHLHQHQQNELAQLIETARKKGDHQTVFAYLITDRSFNAFLETTSMDFWGEDIFHRRQLERATLEKKVQAISTFRLGLIPEESRKLTYITYQFLHGDIWHLAGNMVFLAVVGMGVEAAIGSFFFFIGYLLCGILAGLLYALVTNSPFQPLVGASGSISALMGMYAVVYGLRRIRFFYFVVFYFGYFTAPALAILPVWLVMEIGQAFLNTNSYVAYWAHAGGLIAGTSLLFLTKKWVLQVDDTFYKENENEDAHYREDLNQLMQQISQFNFDTARSLVDELLKKYPNDIPLLTQQYQLSQLQGDNEKTRNLVEALLAKHIHIAEGERRTEALLLSFANAYPNEKLSSDIRFKLLIYFIHPSTIATAERLFQSLMNDKVDDPMLLKAISRFIQFHESNNDKKSSYRYQQLAKALEQQQSQCSSK